MTSKSQTADSLKPITLREVVISVNKEEESKKQVAQEVKVVHKKEIEDAQALSTADVMANAGIPVQKSQLGGGSPILRGFEASRILLMMDGVRLNNLIYRGGHLQDIIKTDPNNLERVEILFGPASTVYGSDALGGVIHLYTRQPVFFDSSRTRIRVQAFSRFESACNGFSNHVDVETGRKKLALLTSVSHSYFSDLMGGTKKNTFYHSSYGTRNFYTAYLGNGKDTLIPNSNRFLQSGSGYSQIDLMQKFLFKSGKYLNHGLQVQYSTSTDIPRYDRLTDPSAATGLKFAEWYYGPQDRWLASYDLSYKKPEGTFEAIQMGLNYQSLTESRHSRSFNSIFRNNRIENVGVFGVHLDFQKKLKEKHDVRFGLEIQLNSLKSTASKENIVDMTSVKLDTRYPDGDNRMNNTGIYYSHTWKKSNKLVFVDGLRIGYSSLRSTLVDTALLFSLPYTLVEQKTPTYSGNLGMIFSPRDDMKISLLLSSGFRVPNVDDLSKIFGSTPGKVIVPNINLKPEQTINYELGISKVFNQKIKWENNFYYTDYQNIAVVDLFQFNGQDSIIYDGTPSRVYANQNKKNAYLYGFSSDLMARLNKQFTLNAYASYTYGRINTDSTDSPLDHIPPFTAKASLKYNYDKTGAECFILYNGWKKIKDYYLNGEDNEQYAPAEGMPAWFTVNLRFSYQIRKYLSLQAGIDNLLDTQYRTFASGINGSGLNFIVALRGRF